MKTFLSALLLVGFVSVQLRADNWLENGDFSAGADHWRGDGRTPSDMAPSDPFAKPDPLFSKGLIIPLKEHDWTKITQDFRTKTADLTLIINLIFSPGLSFSSRDEDYADIPKLIDNPLYLSYNISPHQFLVQFTDFGNGAKGVYYTFTPKIGTTDVQNLQAEVHDLTPLEHEVVTIAFPPGTGSVILQSVSLEGD